jgi:NAD(P)-dependent dehydrogenase (short-subunit alcohol dehydrogenase family)
MNIHDLVVIVTGGASGLGAACARRFVKGGGRVVVADLNEEAAAVLVRELGDSHARAVSTNVADEGSCGRAVKFAWDAFGNLSGVINCAGIGTPEKTVGKDSVPHSLKNFSKTIEVNLVGTFNMARFTAASIIEKKSIAPGVSKQTQGVIVNTASVAAFEGQMGQLAYSASKGGIVAMTLPMARDLAAFGIRVMTIAPGLFNTPMLAGLPEKVRDSLGAQVPFPSRLGAPEEYAQLAQHIFENEMLNGEVIRLDGAIRMTAR